MLDQQRADLIARAAQAALGVNVVAGLAPRDRILTTGVNGDCGPHTVATVLGCMNTTNDKFAALLRAQHAIPAAHPARDEAINKFSKKVRAELEPLLRFTTNSLQTHGQDQQLNRFVHETSRDPKQPNYSTPDKSKPGMGLWDILSESFLVLALVNLAGVAIAGILSVIASIYFAAKNYFVSPTPEHRDPVRRSHNPEHPEGRKVALGEYHDIAAASMPKGPLTPDAPQAQRPANCRPSVMSL